MVERFLPHQRCLYENAQIVDDLVLSAETFELLRADLILELRVCQLVSYGISVQNLYGLNNCDVITCSCPTKLALKTEMNRLYH